VNKFLQQFLAMKTTRWIFSGALILFVGFFILAMRPVPIPAEEDCLTINGTVVLVSESGEKDVQIKLKDVDQIFYINRGLEHGLTLTQLNNDLLYNNVTIKYPEYWTPLDPSNSIRHVSKIEVDGTTIFSELN
jgi:hypothetical protein